MKTVNRIFITLMLLLSSSLALAVIPPTLNYQGHLTDSSGVPVDGPVVMQFAIYDVATGGTAPLWSVSRSVIVDQGVFSVELGSSTAPLPPGLFESPLWMGLTIGTDEQMTPLRPISSVGFSFKAHDADTLEGVHASTLDQSAHVIDTANPHSVTAAQTGAISSAEITLHTDDASAHHTKTTSFTELSDQADDTQLPATIARDAEIDVDISTHALDATAHHARYIDSEAVTAIMAADGAGSTLDADLLDGNDSSAFANALHTHTGSLYSKVAMVAQSGGDYTSPLDAMNDIAAWCGTASSTNPCLVRIMPGIYDLGNNGLMMQAYVDIEGSGENTTTITSTHSSGSLDATSASVTGANNAEIRFLTAENQGGSNYALAVYNYSASPKITNVTATASGGSYSYGVRNSYSSPELTNITATASGGTYSYGVSNYYSSPEITNVTATVSGGTYSYGVSNSFSSPKITNVTAIASGGSSDNYGVRNFSSSPEMVDVSSNGIIIAGNQLFVPASGSDTENGTQLLAVNNVIAGLGAPSATKRYTIRIDAGAYDLGNNGLVMLAYVDIEGSGENTTTITSTHSSGSSDATSATVSGADNAELRFLEIKNQGGSTYSLAIYNVTASPDITNVTAIASGGSVNHSVYNNYSSPKMTNVTSFAFGGTYNYGVSNYILSRPEMTNVTAAVSGGSSSNYGVYNNQSEPEMINVTASASSSGGAANYGVYNANLSHPEMTNVTAAGKGGNAGYGVYNSGSSATIKTSSISGETYSIYNFAASASWVGTTMLDGSVLGSGFICVGVYDDYFAALGTGCL